MNNEAQLSKRELEILELVATGVSNKEIAEELSISQNTVKVHLRNIFSKLGVSTRTEAALTAIQTNLVEFNGFSPNDMLSSDPNSRRTQVSPAETRGIRWTLSLALVGILFLGLVGMLILLRQDESGVDEISTIAPDIESDRWKELAGLPSARNGLALVTYENL
ncbi:MAG: response regulator transcription factor, partial [Candidatus Omnitrophica bacterium]|nr:response regulator transcription factor [Candidatus Omnitrophota bacterium]